MTTERRTQINQLIEACHQTDNGDSEAEKTALIQELLMEIEQKGTGNSRLDR